MSLIIGLNTPECIVVSADSRTTNTEKDGTTSYKDNTDKIIIAEQNIIAFCGDHFINTDKKQTVKTFLEQLCEKHKEKDICHLSVIISNELRNYNYINIKLIIAGYYEFIPYIYTFNTKEGLLKLVFAGEHYGAVFQGLTKIVNNSFDDIKWGSLDEPTAIELAKDWIDITSKMYKYKINQCVGGPTDVCYVKPGGKPIWKYKK